MPETLDHELRYGAQTIAMLGDVLASGVARAALLMRHSAREYAPDRHDLENPLTDEGRDFSRAFGAALPQPAALRGYASPPERCMETAALALAASAAEPSGKVRPVESLGVFYGLDQIKMWKAMREAEGLAPFVDRWVRGELPVDAMIPAGIAAELMARAALHRLETAPPADDRPHVDICVTHDLSLMMLKATLLGEPPEAHPVAYLDAVVLFEREGRWHLRSVHGASADVTERLTPS